MGRCRLDKHAEICHVLKMCILNPRVCTHETQIFFSNI